MLYLTSLSYIDLVPYDHFKTKHNLYLNEYALNAGLNLDVILIFLDK